MSVLWVVVLLFTLLFGLMAISTLFIGEPPDVDE